MHPIDQITFFNQKLHYFTTCSSTQKLAKEQIDSAHKPFVIYSEFQSEGKGQRDTSWNAKNGKNLLFTIGFPNENIELSKLPFINIICSMILIKSIKKFIGSSDKLKIKWPNDLYLNNKKICGILIDTSISKDKVKNLLIGIGINVNQTKFDLPRATSLFLESENQLNKKVILKETLTNFEKDFFKIIKQSELKLMKEYNNSLLSYGKMMRIRVDNKLYEVKNLGIDMKGSISFYDFTHSTDRKYISPKEFEWILD